MSGIREAKKRQTKKDILEAAIKLFSRQGYENTSVDELAREAGVGKGTIYGYFQTKSEIFLVYCQDELECIYRNVTGTEMQGKPLIEQLLALFTGQFRYVTRNRDFGRILAREMIFPKELTLDKVKDLENRYLSVLGQILTRAMERGELRSDRELLHVSGHFYALYVVVLSSWYKGRLQTEAEVIETLKSLFGQALEGLAPAGKRSDGR